MGTNEVYTYSQFQDDMSSHNCTSIPKSLGDFVRSSLTQTSIQKSFSKPMVWIGIYIAVASLFCILPMVADLLHGFKTKKLWFPCKYFTLNAASLTVIAVVVKLPMDLNNSMPKDVDLAAKVGSLAFMCSMMANLLPSLATMGSKELLTNIIALDILIITLVVNVCIQLETGVISGCFNCPGYCHTLSYISLSATTYVAMLLMLLMIHTSSALMITKSKQILESKYKEGIETALNDYTLLLKQPTVEKLKQHVSNQWIMAGTGSPQFMTVCSATTSASGVICVISTVLHVTIMLFTIPHMKLYGSDYKWSVIVILVTQFIGSILGTVAPLSRCFASLSFKVSIKWIWIHIRVFKVESYYTQKLSDWKQSSIPLKLSSRRCKIVIHDLKVLILSFGIGIQKTVVVTCKMIALIPVFFIIGVLCCFHCWKWLKILFGASNNLLAEVPTQLQHNKDRSQYVLLLQDDMELAEGTLNSISEYVTRLIQKAEKQQPNSLMKLLKKYSGFEGVAKYYNMKHQVPPLPEEKYVDCWSLPIVTLTTIAISLPSIPNNKVDRLLTSVTEGLTYVKHVEETLNATDKCVNSQKAATALWQEVEVYRKWLGNKLSNAPKQVTATKEIVQWFSNKAKNILDGSDDISANSMYRITQTILDSHHANIDQKDLFKQLSSMISQILAACLTNLPRVIAMKCHTSVIEKWEESVHTAAQLLGETMQIINSLQEHELRCLNPDELPFIDMWRDCFPHTSP